MRMEVQREGNIRWDCVEKAPQWQWRVVLRDFHLDGPYFLPCGDFESLDIAIAGLEERKLTHPNPANYILVDDQGLQIL